MIAIIYHSIIYLKTKQKKLFCEKNKINSHTLGKFYLSYQYAQGELLVACMSSIQPTFLYNNKIVILCQ